MKELVKLIFGSIAQGNFGKDAQNILWRLNQLGDPEIYPVLMRAFEQALINELSESTTFNLYSLVWVRLTEAGEKTYEDYLKKIGEPVVPVEKDDNGWSQFYLREVMYIFGNKVVPEETEDQFVEYEIRFSEPK